MFLLVAWQHTSGMCQSHFCLVLSLRKVPRKYVELSPNTPPFLTLQFREKDLMPTPNLLQIRLIPPPLGHILSTLQSTQTKSTQNKQHTTTNKMSHATLPQAALPSLSPWVEQRCHQIIVPPLPNAIHRLRAVGLALAVIGLLAWGDKMRGIKK